MICNQTNIIEPYDTHIHTHARTHARTQVSTHTYERKRAYRGAQWLRGQERTRERRVVGLRHIHWRHCAMPLSKTLYRFIQYRKTSRYHITNTDGLNTLLVITASLMFMTASITYSLITLTIDGLTSVLLDLREILSLCSR